MDLPVALAEEAVLKVFGSGPKLNLVIGVAVLVIGHRAHEEAGHIVAAAKFNSRLSVILISLARTGIRTVMVERKNPDGRVGLDVIHLVYPAVKTKFHLVRAMHLVESGR